MRILCAADSLSVGRSTGGDGSEVEVAGWCGGSSRRDPATAVEDGTGSRYIPDVAPAAVIATPPVDDDEEATWSRRLGAAVAAAVAAAAEDVCPPATIEFEWRTDVVPPEPDEGELSGAVPPLPIDTLTDPPSDMLTEGDGMANAGGAGNFNNDALAAAVSEVDAAASSITRCCSCG